MILKITNSLLYQKTKNRIPRHWITFVAETIEELRNVKNKEYEG
jgi:hypothetical protein